MKIPSLGISPHRKSGLKNSFTHKTARQLWALLLLSYLHAQGLSHGLADEVDRFVKKEMERQRIPGLALTVLKDGRAEKIKGYGFANLELKVSVKPATVFQTGSVGKQFTAVGILFLMEEGKLALDDPISKYLHHVPAAWQAITIRHLLGHTSGIPDYYSGETGKDVLNVRLDYTEEEIVDGLARLPLKFAPGQAWSYSSSGYILLGIIIHRISGQFYWDFLQEKIFRPLGMASTRVISNTDIIPNRASGYELKDAQIKNQNDWAAPSLGTTADGCMYTTVVDLAKWDAALFKSKLISPRLRDIMWTPAQFAGGKTVALNNWGGASYNAGWQIDTYWGHRVVEHSGVSQGFTAHISRFLDEGVAVILLENRIGTPARETAHSIAMRMFPHLRPRVALDSTSSATNRILRVLEMIREDRTPLNEFDFRYFGTDSPPEWMRDVSETVKFFGKIQRIWLIEKKDQDGVHRRRYLLNCVGGSLFATILMDDDDKIGWLSVWPE